MEKIASSTRSFVWYNFAVSIMAMAFIIWLFIQTTNSFCIFLFENFSFRYSFWEWINISNDQSISAHDVMRVLNEWITYTEQRCSCKGEEKKKLKRRQSVNIKIIQFKLMLHVVAAAVVFFNFYILSFVIFNIL